MKKLFLIIAAFVMTLTANAQFEQSKIYASGDLTGLVANYQGDNFNLGIQAKGGYFVMDNILAYAQMGYNNNGKDDDSYSVGVGGRYYIIQNGIFLGANGKLVHDKYRNDIMPGVEVGYAFFLSRTVTVEPSIYYEHSFLNNSKYSDFGLRIGAGIYLFTK